MEAPKREIDKYNTQKIFSETSRL